MNIGIEAQRIFRPKKHGMDVVAIELIKNLQLIDTVNHYTVFGRDGVNDIIQESSNFSVNMFPSYTYADWEQINLVKKLKEENLDILHCTANTAPLFCKIPLIVTIHDIIYLEQVDFKGTSYQNIGNLYRRFVVPRIAKRADLILTVSEFEKDNILKKFKFPEQKVEVLYNGVGSQFNTQYSKEDIDAFRKEYNLPFKFIMFLGNTAPKKNTPNVIRAYVRYCNENPDAIPLVLLDYKKELVAKILDDLGQSALLSRFIFPGYVAYRNIPLMYNAATIFLYPSLRESFGLPILEAMACGVPVITSDTSSMPEVAGSAAILINPHNIEELSSAITKLILNERLRVDLIEKGFQRIQQFTWKASAEKLLKIYTSYS